MKVIAKFQVRSKSEDGSFSKQTIDGKTHKYANITSTVVMVPVYDPDPQSENGRFYKYTPSGEIKLSVLNPDAAAAFEIGEEYYVEFTRAES